MYHFYPTAPVACTVGGGECAANADGLTSCPATGGSCVGKSDQFQNLIKKIFMVNICS